MEQATGTTDVASGAPQAATSAPDGLTNATDARVDANVIERGQRRGEIAEGPSATEQSAAAAAKAAPAEPDWKAQYTGLQGNFRQQQAELARQQAAFTQAQQQAQAHQGQLQQLQAQNAELLWRMQGIPPGEIAQRRQQLVNYQAREAQITLDEWDRMMTVNLKGTWQHTVTTESSPSTAPKGAVAK